MPDFMPHGMCFLWRPDILALHVIADGLVALAYFCIPVLLLTFVRERPALRLFATLFATFILGCGLSHVLDIWTIWHADYWLSGAVKAFTAVASLVTVGALLPLMPYGRALRRLGNLQRVNAELESHYRMLVETSNDGIWLMDPSGRTTFVNDRLAEMLLANSSEMIGSAAEGYVHEESADAERTHLVANDADTAPFEVCLRRGDGSPLWTRTRVTAVKTADGHCIGVLATVADATAESAARLALARSERQYRMLAEAMPHIVYTTDAHGTATYHNRAWYDYTGLDETQSSADGWLAAIHPEDRDAYRLAWGRTLANEEPFEVQQRIRRGADGVYRWFVLRAMPMRDEHGTIATWIGSAADIHDFKLATETRSVLDTMGHITKIVNWDGELAYVSPNWWTYTGMRADAGVSATEWRTFVHPDDLHFIDHAQVAQTPAGEVHHSEIRLRRRDGTYRWFLRRTVALSDGEGVAPHHITTLTDIEELRRAQAELIESEMRYRELADAVAQLIWIVDAARTVRYVNAQWSRYTGIDVQVGAQSPMRALLHPDDLEDYRLADAALAPGTSYHWEARIRRFDGVYRWHLICTTPLADHAATEPRWIATATDIEERRTAELAQRDFAAKLAHQARHDALTDLPNRNVLAERLREMIDEGRKNGTFVVVLYLDIDHFKVVNDTLGHNGGDQLLIVTANRIRASVRPDDMASRFGGDEFVIICAADDIVGAAVIAERVQAAVRAPLELAGKRVVVGSSIGISLFPHDGDTAADLIARADSAMYEAKQSGRNAWSFYSAQMQPAVTTLELEAELREAIARDQFVVHYQPIVDVVSGAAIGAEALVRWQHPERGLLPPSEFISFAEEHGLIASIGDIVLNAACAQLRRMHLHPTDEFSIAVNVSARQFARPAFVGSIAAAIAEHELEPRRLEIEITESIVMGDADTVAATLHQLQALGVRLSLDDFGTGYSSLAYLRNFPIHTLKIDRSFVTDIAANFTDQAIAKTIVTLARSLGMRTIAEGVETADQLARLRDFGADCYQGYYASRPLPTAEFAAFIAAQTSIGVGEQ